VRAELLYAQKRLRREAPEWFGRASTRAWKIGRRERANTAPPSIARGYARCQYP